PPAQPSGPDQHHRRHVQHRTPARQPGRRRERAAAGRPLRGGQEAPRMRCGYDAAVKFGIAIPQFFSDGGFDPAAFRAYFSRAEELGFDSAWAQESMLGAAPQLGPLETMTYAAACTQRMRLGGVGFGSTLPSPAHPANGVAPL